MNAVAQATLLESFPVAAGAIGSAVAAVRRPGPRLVSGIQHFAAGVVIAALAGELLPDLRHEGHLGWAAAGCYAAVLAALESVSLVTLFDEATPVELLKLVRPDLYVKGGDYDIETLAETALVRTWGGDARALPFVETSGEGLVLHDAVREAGAAALRAADPGRYGAYRRAAWRALRAQASGAGTPELWRYTADALYLIENATVREAFFPSGAQAHAIEPAAPGDGDALATHREGELAGAMAALGVRDHRFLGADAGARFRDSGMAWGEHGRAVAAPDTVDASRLNQSPRSRTTRRDRPAAPTARVRADRVRPSRRFRAKSGRRSSTISALPPIADRMSIPSPPAST